MVKTQTKVLLLILTVLFVAMLGLSMFCSYKASAAASDIQYSDIVRQVLGSVDSVDRAFPLIAKSYVPTDVDPVTNFDISSTGDSLWWANSSSFTCFPSLSVGLYESNSGYCLTLVTPAGNYILTDELPRLLFSCYSPTSATSYNVNIQWSASSTDSSGAPYVPGSYRYHVATLITPVKGSVTGNFFSSLEFVFYFASSDVPFISDLNSDSLFSFKFVLFNAFYNGFAVRLFSPLFRTDSSSFSFNSVTYYTPFYYSLLDCTRAYQTALTGSVSYDLGFNDGVKYADGRVDTSSLSYEAGYTRGSLDAESNVNTSSASYTAGVNDGKTTANNTVTKSSASWSAGYSAGVDDAGSYTFNGLLGAVFDVPVNAFRQFFNFEILGVNLTALFSAVFVILFVVTIVRLTLGG